MAEGISTSSMKLPFILTLIFYTTFIPLQAQVGIGVEVEAGDEEPDQPIIWVGPGWYYGVWFDDEYAYNDWYGHHHGHDHHHDHHHGGGHHGGGHGGGRHHHK